MSMLVALIVLSSVTICAASDADPLQAFCIADLSQNLTLNGFPCMDPKLATSDDFFFHGLGKPLNPDNNPSGFAGAAAVAATFPALNTLGMSVVKLSYAANGGIVPPHTHPLATEVLYVLEGSLYAGFVTNDDYRLFAKVANKGDLIVVPRGLIHWQYNVGNTTAVALAMLNSQNPGSQAVSYAMFGTGIPDEVLQKTYFVDKKTIDALRASVTAAFS